MAKVTQEDFGKWMPVITLRSQFIIGVVHGTLSKGVTSLFKCKGQKYTTERSVCDACEISIIVFSLIYSQVWPQILSSAVHSSYIRDMVWISRSVKYDYNRCDLVLYQLAYITGFSWPPAAVAEKDGTPVFKFPRWRVKGLPIPEVVEAYKSVGAELNVMPFCSQFIPMNVIDHPKHGSIIYHPSLLPRHRGASSINWWVSSG